MKHTPGAIRAAEIIQDHGRTGCSRDFLVYRFAQIIEEETGLAELLEAAKEALESLEMIADDEKTTFAGQVALRAAIAKAEGE